MYTTVLYFDLVKGVSSTQRNILKAGKFLDATGARAATYGGVTTARSHCTVAHNLNASSEPTICLNLSQRVQRKTPLSHRRTCFVREVLSQDESFLDKSVLPPDGRLVRLLFTLTCCVAEHCLNPPRNCIRLLADFSGSRTNPQVQSLEDKKPTRSCSLNEKNVKPFFVTIHSPRDYKLFFPFYSFFHNFFPRKNRWSQHHHTTNKNPSAPNTR